MNHSGQLTCFVMLVQSNELGRSNAKMIEQPSGMTRVLGNDNVSFMEHFGSTGGYIPKMADWCGHHIQDAGKSGNVRGLAHDGDSTGSAMRTTPWSR